MKQTGRKRRFHSGIIIQCMMILVLACMVCMGVMVLQVYRQYEAEQCYMIEKIAETVPEQAPELIAALFAPERHGDVSVLAENGYTIDGFRITFFQGRVGNVMQTCILVSCAMLLLLLFLIGWYRHRVQGESQQEIKKFKENQEAVRERYVGRELRKAQMFVENVAHQIKTAVCGTQLTLESLREHICGTQPMEEKEALDLIDECSRENERMQTMLVRLMQIGRLEAGRVELEREMIHLDEMLFELKERMDLKGGLSGDSQVQLWGDSNWLYEAFFNLLSNCQEYADRVWIQLKENEENVQVMIRDDGPGIEQKKLPYIFDRFYTTSSAKQFHMGIGLNLAKEIFDAHQAYVHVGHAEEGGSFFRIEFPKWKSLKV